MSRPLSLSELHSRNLRVKANLQRKPPSLSCSDDFTSVKSLQASIGRQQPASIGTSVIFDSSMTSIVELISEEISEGPIVTLGPPALQKSQSTGEKLPIPNQSDEAKVDIEADEAFRLCLEALLKSTSDAPKNTKDPIPSTQDNRSSDRNGMLGNAKSCSNGEIEDLRTGEVRHKAAGSVSSSSISSSSGSSKRNRGDSTNKSSSSRPKARSGSRKRKSSNGHRSRSRSKNKERCSSRPSGRSNSRTKGKNRKNKLSKRRLTELEIARMKADASLGSLVHGIRARRKTPIKTLNNAENVGGWSKQSSQTETLKNGVKCKELPLPVNLPSQFSVAVRRYLEIFNLSGLEQSDDDDLKEDKLLTPVVESSLLSRGTCSDNPAGEDQKPKLPEPSQVDKTPEVGFERIQGILKSIGLNFEVSEIGTLSARVKRQSHVTKGSSGSPECSNTSQSSDHLSQSVVEAMETDCAIYKTTDAKPLGQKNPPSIQSPASLLGHQSVDLSLGQQNDGTVLQNSSAPVTNAPPVVNLPAPHYRVSNYATAQMPCTYEQINSGASPTYAQYLPAPGWPSCPPTPQFNRTGSVHRLPPSNAGTGITSPNAGTGAPLSDEKNEEFQKQKVVEERLKLKAERENIKKKIAFLQKELASVHKELGELMHVKHRERNGYKDPALQEVQRASDYLLRELSVLTKEDSLAAEKQSELDTIAKIFGVDTGKSRKQSSENKEVPIDLGRRQERSRSQEKPSKRELTGSQERGSRAERSRSHERASKRERSRSNEKSSRRECSKSQEKTSRAERSRSRERPTRGQRSISHERASRVECTRSRERASKRGRSRSQDKHPKRESSRRQNREKRSSSREMSPSPIQDTCSNTESSSVKLPKSAKRLTDSALSSSAKCYEYYDAGNHWCRECNSFCGTLLDFFSHMHHKKHQQTLDPDSKPWAEKPQGEPTENSINTGSKIAVPAKGPEFLIPLSGFYCTLCDEMFGDQISCEKHVKCYIHNENYKKYIESHLLYEERRSLDRQAGLAAAMEAKRRHEREMKRRLEETHREGENHEESTEKHLLKSKTVQRQAPSKPAPLTILPIESIKLYTTNEDMGGKGGMEGTKGNQMQTGMAKPITIKIAKKPLPLIQAKIRPDLPAPTMVQRNSGLTHLNKPAPLNTFLSIKSGLTNKLPLGKTLTNFDLVVASDMPKVLKTEGNASIPGTQASTTTGKPAIPVVYGYGVKVLKSNLGPGPAPVQKLWDRSIMLPASLVQNQKGVTTNSNNPYSMLQASAGVQDPGVSVPVIHMETEEPSTIITQTNICIGSANARASSPEILADFKCVGSESRGNVTKPCALENSQVRTSDTFVFEGKTGFVALEGMQQKPSEAITKMADKTSYLLSEDSNIITVKSLMNSEASVTSDSGLHCQRLGDVDAPEIKRDAKSQGGWFSTHAPVLAKNYSESKGVAMSLTIGLEDKLVLGQTSKMLDISPENVVHRHNQPSQATKEGSEPLDISHAALVPMQPDESKDSCFTAPEPSEHVKADVLAHHDGVILDAALTDMPTVSVEEDFDDSELEEQVGSPPKTCLTMPVVGSETLCRPAHDLQIADSIDDDPESPDTSEEATYLSD